jgi:hypothetical protein
MVLKVQFNTVTSEILKVTPQGMPVQMPAGYERIVGIHGDGELVAVNSDHAAFDNEDNGEVHQSSFDMSQQAFQRLLGYVASRFTAQHPPQGSCHDFGAYMQGYDIGHIAATRMFNQQLLDMTLVPDTHNIQADTTLVVGHPDYARRGPLQKDGNLHPDFTANVHGPLSIVHTCLSLASPESMALQRMALDGPLGIMRTQAALAHYAWGLQTMCDGQWDGSPPQSQDIALYRLDQ